MINRPDRSRRDVIPDPCSAAATRCFLAFRAWAKLSCEDLEEWSLHRELEIPTADARRRPAAAKAEVVKKTDSPFPGIASLLPAQVLCLGGFQKGTAGLGHKSILWRKCRAQEQSRRFWITAAFRPSTGKDFVRWSKDLRKSESPRTAEEGHSYGAGERAKAQRLSEKYLGCR